MLYAFDLFLHLLSKKANKKIFNFCLAIIIEIELVVLITEYTSHSDC